MKPVYYLLPLLLFAQFVFGASPQQTLSSGVQKNQLIELYTSEGCSSCPPADQWLSRYKQDTNLWKDIVPVAFHVDYWDYIGWPDRFAKPAYTKRQRLHAKQKNLRQVYTPGFVVDGKEWKGWFRSRPLPIKPSDKPGVLSLTFNDTAFTAQFQPEPISTGAKKLTIAILGFDLQTPVKAGENKGELLSHDFVVLAIKDYQLSGESWRGQLPTIDTDHSPRRLAISAWVSDPHSLKPVQALGGWLDRAVYRNTD